MSEALQVAPTREGGQFAGPPSGGPLTLPPEGQPPDRPSLATQIEVPIGGGRQTARAAAQIDWSAIRRRRERNGRIAEWVACGLLLLKGYRILARRVKMRSGEIDVVAVRGGRLAFVEVKQRRTVQAARGSITDRQIGRIRAAAECWVWHHRRYREHRIGLDAVLVGPGFWPRHLPDALQK